MTSQKSFEMPKNSSKTWIIIATVLVATLITVAIIGKKQGWIGGAKAVEVNFDKSARVNIVEKVSASGKIQPQTEIRIAPDVSGEITDMYVAEGDSVQKGQLLLRIRPDNYQTAVSRAEAGYNAQRATLSQTKMRFEQAKAQLARAKSEFERNKTLFEQKVISELEFLTFKTNYEVAQSEYSAAEQSIEAARYTVESSQATVREAQKNLQLTEVYAPASGIISKMSVKKGERVVGTIQMTGTEMLRIANLHEMEVRVDVNENDIVRVSLGDTALVEVDAYSGRKFYGVVSSIANSAKEALGNVDAVTEFEVKIRLINSSYSDLIKPERKYPFRPGMTASVEIITQRKENVLAVPLAAVTTRDPNSKFNKAENQEENAEETTEEKKKSKVALKEVVFVHKDGKAILREVKTGISDFDYIEILEGLQEGEEIISGPFSAVSKKLSDGDMVKKAEVKEKKEK
jgi:HlyD family secretion protein